MEAADVRKEEGKVMMLTTILDPPKARGVKVASRTGKGNLPRNVGTVARRRVSVGRSAPIQRNPDPDPEKQNKEIGSGRTTSKDRKGSKESERGQPS